MKLKSIQLWNELFPRAGLEEQLERRHPSLHQGFSDSSDSKEVA